MTFVAYIDDSGTARDQKVASATALIIPKQRIVALESEWDSFKKNYGIKAFHTSECVARNQHSEFSSWDDTRVKSALTRVRHIAKKYGVRAFSLAIPKSDYDAIIPEDLKPKCGIYQYTWAVRSLVIYIDDWAVAFGAAPPVEYVFDWMDPRSDAKREIDIAMVEAEIARPGRFVGHYSFKRREGNAGLQCVDSVAWTCYRFALHAMEKRMLSELHSECWHDYKNHRGVDKWLLALGQKPEQIRDFVKRRLEVNGDVVVRLVPFIR